MNATTVNMTSEKPGGKTITKAITFINPDATDAQIADFIVGLAGLSNNILKNVEKVSTVSVPFNVSDP